MLLSEIETNLRNEHWEEARTQINHLALPILLQWEAESALLRDGLDRLQWWDWKALQMHPINHERLKKSAGRRANGGGWRKLVVKPIQGEPYLWQTGAQVATHLLVE